jgi:cytochrome P450
VGKQLAKVEFATALEELTARLPSLRLAKAQDTTFLTNTSFRVPSQVLVKWEAA